MLCTVYRFELFTVDVKTLTGRGSCPNKGVVILRCLTSHYRQFYKPDVLGPKMELIEPKFVSIQGLLDD